MKLKITVLTAAVLCMSFSYNTHGQSGTYKKNIIPIQNDGNWISIFNGKNLDGWIPKVTGYCYRNSGVMIHSQSPESMDIKQNWPVSIEVQLLGSTDSVKQKTANICTPGTTVFYKGSLTNEHCISSNSKYFYDNEWVNLEITVHGGKTISMVIDRDTVLTISRPQIGGYLLPENYPIPTGTVLEDGFIALQGEGTNIDFRKIALKILDEPKIKSK
jgi:hypothetical protein